MWRELGLNRVLCSLIIFAGALLLTSCQSQPTRTGYWEGKGTAREIGIKDDFKQLTRSAEFNFWFVVDRNGDAVGETEIVYDGELRVENLPQVNLGFASFNPNVGGKVTDLDPRRRFSIVGVLSGGELVLQLAVPEEGRKPIEFTLRADPGLGVTFGVPLVPPVSGRFGGGGGYGTIVQKIPMTPFDPFGGKAKIEKRPGGPFAARVEVRGEKSVIEWSARQVGGEQRAVGVTPEMEVALRQLREGLGIPRSEAPSPGPEAGKPR